MEALMKHVTVTEAAELMGCTTGYIRRLLLDGELKGEKLGPIWVVEKTSIAKFDKREKTVGRPRVPQNQKSA